MKKYLILLVAICCISGSLYSQKELKENFENNKTPLTTVGRGTTLIKNGTLSSKGSYASFGNKEWADYTIRFKARTPKSEEQVQIWSGFRAFNKFDRYVLGFRGGLQNNFYLSRMGYMGRDEMLALTPLDFHPETGKWYEFKIEVCQNRIRVFLNNETLPRIDVTDENTSMAPSGPVILGGGWLETEFDDLTIEPLAENALKDVPVKIYRTAISKKEKEKKRVEERKAYQPVVISKLDANRTNISLDGNWLFMPTYELEETEKAVSLSTDDQNWHIMKVPEFWTPTRNWLHGERFGIGKKRFSKGVSDAYFEKETDRCESLTFDYVKTKAAWYRQWIELPGNIDGKILKLSFDAVAKVAKVYINGKIAASHIGMFGEFEADGTGLFKPGKNLVAVYVTKDQANTSKDEPDYYTIARLDEDPAKKKELAAASKVTGQVLKNIAHSFYGDPAGIWQPVHLVVSDLVKVEDVFIKPALDGATFEVTVKNYSNKKTTFDLNTRISEANTGKLFHSENSLKKVELKPEEERVLSYKISGLKPQLWSFKDPNLYDFSFQVNNNDKVTDQLVIRSGFRTFETKGDYFYLNGHPYWLRGGNHIPFTLARDNEEMANTFYQLMRDANLETTRAVCSPFNELWTSAADAKGIGISHEGTWPWLMINNSMPDSILISMWADEYLSLIKKYRNHPSIIIWTINNEMKFYDNEPDPVKKRKKMEIISDVVKRLRVIDPTRPICFDSNYRRDVAKLGEDFYKGIDDGDIDDIHSYINWYNHSVFEQFNGEFQQRFKNQGRPLISQEMSTGYPNNETGHAVKFYTLMHQNPQTLVGYEAYDYADPNAFLKVQSFITGELAEALRRSNDKTAGIIHFALITWFRNVYDPKRIEPYPTYYAMQRAMQPILVSAEIWGRNLYAGEALPVNVYVVNDSQERKEIGPTQLQWELVAENGKVLASGQETVPGVKYYARTKIAPQIMLPKQLPQERINAKLKLKLTENGVQVSANEYDLLIAQKDWIKPANNKTVVIFDPDNLSAKMDYAAFKYTKKNSVAEALKEKADLIIFSGIDDKCSDDDIKKIREAINKGKNVLVSNSPKTSKKLYPEYITGHIVPTEGDIVSMETPESPVFDHIGTLELRYFNNNKREVPKVCNTAFKINRSENVSELASHIVIHGYISGDINVREQYMNSIKGYTMLEINDNGKAILSTMSFEKCDTDPVAAKLLANTINYLLNK